MPEHRTPEPINLVCAKCGRALPAAEFYRQRASKTGHQSYCKRCSKAGVVAWNRDNHTWVLERSSGYRTGHRGQIRAWVDKNRDKLNSRAKELRAENPEKYRARERQWLSRPGVKERRRQERRRFKKRHPEAHQVKKQKRRAKIQSLPHDMTRQQWLLARALLAGRCAYCGRTIAGHVHQDHVIPLVDDGPYTMGNVLPACADCNQGKGTRDFRSWMRSKGHDVPRVEDALVLLGMPSMKQVAAELT